MKNAFLSKFVESIISVFPVALIVVILGLTPLAPLSLNELIIFGACALILVLGICLFNVGADIAMTPMGKQVGSGLTKSKKLTLLIVACFIMGVLITIAEPDLSVLANNLKGKVDSTLLLITVGVGVGLFLIISVLKVIFKKPLSSILFYTYLIIFCLSSLLLITGNTDFLPLAFDSGGVTTGPITVPFIMALGSGIALTIGGKNSAENSFGLIALCSIGPIIAVMILGLTSNGNANYIMPDYSVTTNFFETFGVTLLHTAKSVSIALGMIIVFFLVLQFTILKLPKQKLLKIAIGVLYTFVGLVIFLTAVEVGFVPIGYKLGESLALNAPTWVVVLIGFIIGLVVVLAEPAVLVLNKQVEDITNGRVSKKSMMIALSIGVGISIALSILRIIFDFNVLYYLIPGYLLSLGLSFFVPSIYTAIAFDSGGVASGPLTSSFILPMAIGICYALYQTDAKIMSDAFGIVAMVAMTPLITIQLLGFNSVMKKRRKEKRAMQNLLSADDEQIIDFM